MSSVRPLQWRYKNVADQATATGYAASIWGHSNFYPAIGLATGETVIRTRLQLNLMFGVQGLAPTTFPLPQLWYQGMIVRVGLYCDPTLPFTSTPPDVEVDTSDGGWLMNDLLMPRLVNYGNEQGGNSWAEVNFQTDAGTFQSFGKRGPVTAATSGVYLCWFFNSADTFWELNSTDFFGYMGGSSQVSALVMTAP